MQTLSLSPHSPPQRETCRLGWPAERELTLETPVQTLWWSLASTERVIGREYHRENLIPSFLTGGAPICLREGR
jgi:hypothetical protein